MGRVIDDGGVFAPRLELKRIQQGRIPFRERLAEKYLSPTGVAQTMRNVGQIASLLGEIEFDPMKQKTGQDAAKSVAQQRIGGELPEGMTRVGMATGQGAPSVDLTAREAGREVILPGRGRTPAGLLGQPRQRQEISKEEYERRFPEERSVYPEQPGGIPEANLGVMTDFAQGLKAAPALDKLASDAPIKEQVMPTQEEYEASLQQPAPTRTPTDRPFTKVAPATAPVPPAAPVPEAMEPEPYVPTDRPAAPAAAPAAAAPAAPVAPAMTLKQRVRKVLDDISAPTYEGQQNALRAMAMQADTAEAQSAIINALSEVKIPARGIADLAKARTRRDNFRKEIIGLFPSVKKPPAPMTEKERLGLEAARYRAETERERLAATKEERAAARKEREAKRKSDKEKRDEAKRARRAKGRVSGAKTLGQLRAQIEKEIATATNRIKVQSPRMRTVRERIGVLKKREGELLRLQAKQEKPEKPIKRPSKKARSKEIALYEAAVRRRDTREAARKEALSKTEGELEKVRTSIAGLNPEFVAMGASRNRRENYQRALRALQTSGMPVSDMRTALQNLIGLQADPGRDDSEVTSMFAEFARNPRSLLQMQQDDTARSPLVYNPATKDTKEERFKENARVLNAVFDRDAKRKIAVERIGVGRVRALIEQGEAGEVPSVTLEGADGVLSEKGQRVLIEQYQRGRYQPNYRFYHPMTFSE